MTLFLIAIVVSQFAMLAVGAANKSMEFAAAFCLGTLWAGFMALLLFGP